MGATLTELVNENYLTQINDWAKAHGTKFRSQTYGEPAVIVLSAASGCVCPRAKGRSGGHSPRCAGRRSANHVFGNDVTSARDVYVAAFAGVSGDSAGYEGGGGLSISSMGVNQLIFHGWPYSPPTGVAGAGMVACMRRRCSTITIRGIR